MSEEKKSTGNNDHFKKCVQRMNVCRVAPRMQGPVVFITPLKPRQQSPPSPPPNYKRINQTGITIAPPTENESEE